MQRCWLNMEKWLNGGYSLKVESRGIVDGLDAGDESKSELMDDLVVSGLSN